jgi:hypothetical protein
MDDERIDYSFLSLEEKNNREQVRNDDAQGRWKFVMPSRKGGVSFFENDASSGRSL